MAAEDSRTIAIGPLVGGQNDSVFETELKPGETPSSLNMDFDRGSIRTTRGSIPFNRQSAPLTAIRTTVDEALSPLAFAPNMAVPLRGYAVFPYNEDYDIGGRFDLEGDPLAGPSTYYNRRGHSFEFNIAVRIPPEEKLYETETRGAAAPAAGAESAGFTGYPFDEAQDECFCILQKGGDRTSPMSWALAVVNIGRGLGFASLPATRPSNYAFVFMWLDSVGWGVSDQPGCRYNLTTGQLPTGAATQNATQAYRAIVIHKYVVPGRRYMAAVQLSLDTGSPGAVATNTAWNQNGYIKVWVGEDGGPPQLFSIVQTAAATITRTGMEVIRGPSDSDHYLLKYGIRFAGRDEMFAGLGQRFIPWQIGGFLPFGQDLTPLKNGGFQMVDRSVTVDTITTLYGAGAYTLTATHTAGDTFVVFNHQGLSVGNTNGGASPWGQGGIGGPGAYTRWMGLGAGSGAGNINANALKGYSLVIPRQDAAGVPAGMRGAVLKLGAYTELAGPTRYTIDVAAPGAMGSWGAFPALIQCFRWHQRPLEIGEIRIWSAPRGYDAAGNPIVPVRRKMSLRQSIIMGDETEPDIANLIAYWPCDDGGGTTLSERVVGGVRAGFFAPMGLGTTTGSLEGDDYVFISGEGEAPCVDLSANPIFMREVGKMLSGNSPGFAIELSCVFTGASYAIQDNSITLPDSGTAGLPGSRPRFVPEILSWDVKDPRLAGMASQPKPLITLTHRGALTTSNLVPFQFPMGFSVEVAHRTDQENIEPIVPSDLLPAYIDAGGANKTRYGLTAPWVGKNVTIQIGIQSTGTVDQYDVYIAMSPKDAFNPEPGDPSSAEFAYFTAGGGSYSAGGGGITYAGYFAAAHLTIRAKDLARSVITIGRFNCNALGFCELQPRLLVGKLRFYATAASGSLPTTNGAVVVARNGKLEGSNAMPQGLLAAGDLLRPLGHGLRTANVTDGSASVAAPSRARFFSAEPAAAIDAVKGSYFYIPGDKHDTLTQGTLGTTQEQFYFVSAINTNFGVTGSTLTIATPFEDASRNNAYAASLRLLFYTAFEDDIRDKLLTFGAGRAFEPGVTTVSDVILTEDFWQNVAPVTGNMKLRVYSPFGRTSVQEIMPKWVRGLVAPRLNPIRGGYVHKENIYLASKGSIYKTDDRWREDGPTEDLPRSLEFFGTKLFSAISRPLHSDYVDFATNDNLKFAGASGFVYEYEAWLKVSQCADYQTILWFGDPASDPSLNASASGHKFQMAMRLNRMRPEFVIGSTAFYTGTTVPEKGFFVATGATPIDMGDGWVHIRWYLPCGVEGTILLIPHLKVNGKAVSVTVNARDNNAAITQSYHWLRVSTIVDPGATAHAWLGASHDAFRAPKPNVAFSSAALGTNVQPQRYVGQMHSLCGRLAQVLVARRNVWAGSDTGAAPPNFDPYNATLADVQSLRFNALWANYGVGHRVKDAANDQFGVIYSHPFISIWHELGDVDVPASFAEFGEIVYATKGGLPARIQNGHGGLAGVLAPTQAPGFRIERFPLWRPNKRNGILNDTTQDPVEQAATGAALQINHFDNHGNNYLEQTQANAAGETEISWVNVAGTFRYRGIKALIKMRDASGYRILWRRGADFLAVNDGKVRYGWYDLYLKRDVWVESDSPVIEAGRWQYVNLRKRWPQRDVNIDGSYNEGNWENEFWSNGKIRRALFTSGTAGTFQVGETVTWTAGGGAIGTGMVTKVYGAAASVLEFILLTGGPAGPTSAYTGGTSGATGTTSVAATRPMKDKLVVRTFDLSTPAFGFEATLGAKISLTTRSCISFTTTSTPPPAGTTATGQVSLPGVRYTAAGNQINAPANIYPFHPDMVGMYWQWGTVGGGQAASVGKLFKMGAVAGIAVGNGYPSATFFDAGTNTNSTFAVAAATEGAIFSGVALVRTLDFNDSKMPDDASAKVYAFGHPDSANPISGIAPFDGEFDSFGWTSIDDTDGSGARVFENVDSSLPGLAVTTDPVEIGTDIFENDIFSASAAGPGRLHFDDWAAGPPAIGAFFCVNGRTYAGPPVISTTITEPNTGLAINPDSTAAGPTSSTNTAAALWKYLQAASVMAGTRYARIAFYDREQNEVSNPSPSVAIRPQAEDTQNPSGQVRYVITDLPVPRQAGDFEVWAYLGLSAAIEDVTMFRVAEVSVGTREIAVMMPDSQIAGLPAISFTQASPPRCSILTAAQGRIFYGRLEAQPDGLLYSLAGGPVSIDDAPGVTRLSGGSGPELTLMQELDGLVVLAKRRAIASLVVNLDGTASVSIVTTGAGCISYASAVSDQSRLYFVSERGIEVMRRSVGQTALGLPRMVSEKVKTFFDELDRRFALFISGAINRFRNQYVITARAVGAKRTSRRLAVEYDQALAGTPVDLTEVAGYRFSPYECPNVTTLLSVPSKGGGHDRLIGGTEEGMAVWLDDERSLLCMAGEDAGLWGFSFIANSLNKDPLAVSCLSSGQIDQSLEGPKGLPVRWIDDDGAEQMATCIGGDSSVLHFDAISDHPAPLQTRVTVGAQVHRWELPWMDLGNAHKRKMGEYLNLVAAAEEEGEVHAAIYGDFNRDRVLVEGDVALVPDSTAPFNPEMVISDAEGRTLKAVLSSVPLAVGNKFEVAKILLTVRDQMEHD